MPFASLSAVRHVGGRSGSTQGLPKGPILRSAKNLADPRAPYAAAALKFAFIGVVLFTVVYFGRPEDWIHGTAVLPSAKATGLVAVAGVLAAIAFGCRPSSTSLPIVLVLLLVVQLMFTIPFSFWKMNSLDIVVNGFFKIVIIAGAMTVAVDSLGRLKVVIIAHTLCLAANAFVAMVRYSGGRLSGAVKGPFANPNDLAFNLVLAIPFCLVFIRDSRRLLPKFGWVAIMAVLLLATTLTYSRGAFVSLLAVSIASMCGFGASWIRKPWFALSCFVLLGLLFACRPADYTTRLLTIFNPSEDSTGSSQERRGLLQQSIELSLENPLVGVGPGNFRNFASNWRETHNTYTQFASEAGLPAFILFTLLLIHGLRSLSKRRYTALGDDRLLLYAAAVRASLVGYIVGAAFLSTAYEVFPYILIAYSVIISRISHFRSSVAPLGRSDNEPGQPMRRLQVAPSSFGRPCAHTNSEVIAPSPSSSF